MDGTHLATEFHHNTEVKARANPNLPLTEFTNCWQETRERMLTAMAPGNNNDYGDEL